MTLWDIPNFCNWTGCTRQIGANQVYCIEHRRLPTAPKEAESEA